MNVNEHRIREFAYHIWESEGKPQGQASRHWDMACKLADHHDEDDLHEETASSFKQASGKSNSNTSTSYQDNNEADVKTAKKGKSKTDAISMKEASSAQEIGTKSNGLKNTKPSKKSKTTDGISV